MDKCKKCGEGYVKSDDKLCYQCRADVIDEHQSKRQPPSEELTMSTTEKQGPTPGPWKSTFTIKKKRGVRAKSGFICFLPSPTHYSGQDKRYEEELAERKANAELIAAAPKTKASEKRLLEACERVLRYMEQPKLDTKTSSNVRNVILDRLDDFHAALSREIIEQLQTAIDKATL